MNECERQKKVGMKKINLLRSFTLFQHNNWKNHIWENNFHQQREEVGRRQKKIWHIFAVTFKSRHVLIQCHGVLCDIVMIIIINFFIIFLTWDFKEFMKMWPSPTYAACVSLLCRFSIKFNIHNEKHTEDNSILLCQTQFEIRCYRANETRCIFFFGNILLLFM